MVLLIERSFSSYTLENYICIVSIVYMQSPTLSFTFNILFIVFIAYIHAFCIVSQNCFPGISLTSQRILLCFLIRNHCRNHFESYFVSDNIKYMLFSLITITNFQFIIHYFSHYGIYGLSRSQLIVFNNSENENEKVSWTLALKKSYNPWLAFWKKKNFMFTHIFWWISSRQVHQHSRNVIFLLGNGFHPIRHEHLPTQFVYTWKNYVLLTFLLAP